MGQKANTALELSENSLQNLLLEVFCLLVPIKDDRVPIMITILISFEDGTSNSRQIVHDPNTTMQLPEGRVLVAAQEGDAARRRGDGRRRRRDGQRRYGVEMRG